MRRLWIITGLFFMILPAFSQDLPTRCTYISSFNTPVKLDTLSVVPGSIYTVPEGAPLSYDLNTGMLTVRMAFPPDSIQVCYSVFPLAFDKVYRRNYSDQKDQVRTGANSQDTVIRLPTGVLSREEIFATQGLSKSGTLSRGISFGNNQDVFVNSTLNLNLDGRLTDDLNIRAAITDQNIPFQPEGNTQQLQDFDNVYVEIYNDRLSLLAGDIVLQQRPSEFLRYYKNVQGGRASYTYALGNGEATTALGVSVAKGQFESTLIPAKEGVLGPYRIPGPEGQAFVIILANSERVFLDGVLLERGFNRDYTIDYNQGQITFTNRVLITEFSRIRIDYEYSDQNYNRSILAGYHEQRSGQWELRAQVYREGDNRNRPLFGTLSNEDKERLSQAGDDPTRALTSGVDSAAYSIGEVRYEKRDTVHSGGIQSEIYVYSTDPGRAWYRVRFSQTGPNQGNYVLDRITANGRVYKWVAPVNGVPQGDHTPFVRLPMPNKRQMVSLAGAFKPNDHEEVFVETAFSGQDRNLFSTLDDGDNNGVAVKTGMRSSGRKLNFLKDYAWEAYTDVEYDDRNFQAIDRFRTIEFNRDWNFNPRVDTARAAEKIVNAGFSMRKDNDRFLSYGITYRNREDQVNGFQHRAELGQQFKKIRIRGDLFQMNSVVPDFKASWTRLNTGISLRQAKWVPGYQFSLDRNTQSFADRDTSAMSFIAHQFYIHQGADSKWEYDLRHTYREDDRPQNGVILPYSTSNTTRFTLARTLGNHRLQALFTYRLQELENNEQDEETISSRVEWQGNWLKNIIRTDVTYAVLNSQELRREYVYIRVPAGEGTHTWRDLNEDNVQDLNEFFIAVNPDERNYAKIFVPTDEFVTAFQNLFVAQARIQMPAEWREKGGLPALLSRLSNNTSWTADNKITSDNLADKLFAFARSVDEEEILAQRDIFRSTTFFNRSNALYGLEFTYLDAKQKQLLTSGFEGSENRSYSYVLRFNPEQAYNLKLRAAHGTRRSFSDFLTDRNYLVRTQRINPEAAWQPGVHHRFTLQYAFEKKDNKQEEVSPEYSRSNTFQFEYRFAKAASSALQAQFSLINIEFSGVENTPVGYELLNALRPGRNLTWSLVWQQKITKGLQLNLSYDGRSSEDQRAIHTGRIQVSALF